MPRHGLSLLLMALVALSLNALLANAQFGNMFQNMFGQEQTHQQQHFQNHHGASVRGWQIQDEGESVQAGLHPYRLAYQVHVRLPSSSMFQRIRLPWHSQLRQGPGRMPLSIAVSAFFLSLRPRLNLSVRREDFKCLLPTDPKLGSHGGKEPFVCVRGTTNGKTARQECDRIQKVAQPI